MKTLRLAPLVVGVSAVLVTVGVAAVFGGLPGGGSTSDRRAISVSMPAAEAGGTDCPSAEEVRAYWEKYGKDLKSAGRCGDPDPLPPGDGTGEAPVSGRPPPTPTTMAEAQAVLDPDDDPLLLLHQDKNGGWSAILVALAPGQDEPPPSVRTVEQFSAWVAAQNAN
jgi:hypothetical protein